VLPISLGKRNRGIKEETKVRGLGLMMKCLGDGGPSMTGIIEDQSVPSPDSEKFNMTNSLKTSVESGQETPSVVQHYVEGEYQPPPFSYGYSSSQQSLPAETNREIPSTDNSISEIPSTDNSISEIPSTDNLISETPNIIPEAPMESEAPIHETSDIVENIAAEEPPEHVIEEKGKGRGVDFVPPFTAWNPAR
jgi:hypothetical protein